MMNGFCKFIWTAIPILLLSTLMLPTAAYTQSFSDKKSSFEGYFDNDKKLDRVTVVESSASGGAGFRLVCKFSTQARPIQFLCDYSFSEFLFIASVPDVVTNRVAFAKKLASKLVPEAVNDSKNPAYLWLLQACANGQIVNGEQSTDYKTAFSYLWQDKLSNLSAPSYALIGADSIRCLLDAVQDPDIDMPKTRFYIAFYMGNNHGEIVKTLDTAGCSFLVTRHGVLQKKGGKYAWVFINENSIFQSGPEKLRWRSIENVEVKRDHLIVTTVLSPAEVKRTFTIDLKSGEICRLKLDAVSMWD